MTLEEAKQILRDNWVEGIDCLCCGQMVKKYSRKLTSSMARGLISLYKQSSDQEKYIHISKIASVNGGEFAQLKRWGLINDAENPDTTKRVSGLWMITDKGRFFVENEISVPMYCETYNGKTLSFSDETTNIERALGNRFDYTELMVGKTIEDKRFTKAMHVSFKD